ncbi:hypothetical protein J6590_037762 [Homalodisca vitripennis]|nr:hypothetical protein J6590_037762 [Homalodisca vitripennis]
MFMLLMLTIAVEAEYQFNAMITVTKGKCSDYLCALYTCVSCRNILGFRSCLCLWMQSMPGQCYDNCHQSVVWLRFERGNVAIICVHSTHVSCRNILGWMQSMPGQCYDNCHQSVVWLRFERGNVAIICVHSTHVCRNILGFDHVYVCKVHSRGGSWMQSMPGQCYDNCHQSVVWLRFERGNPATYTPLDRDKAVVPFLLLHCRTFSYLFVRPLRRITLFTVFFYTSKVFQCHLHTQWRLRTLLARLALPPRLTGSLWPAFHMSRLVNALLARPNYRDRFLLCATPDLCKSPQRPRGLPRQYVSQFPCYVGHPVLS